jgi:hypothetical protein
MTETNAMMNKIMALLAKAESTEYEAEAAAYLAKAEQLMVRYSIEQADLKPAERDKIVTMRVDITRNRPDHVLRNNVAIVNDVSFLRDWDNRHGTLVGYEADIAFVQALVASLILQRETFLAHEPRPEYEHGRTFNHGFRLGFANRVYRRLLDAKAKIVRETGTGTELVLASKRQQVEDRFKELFPKTSKGPRATTSSAKGYYAGKAAAERADTSGGRNKVGAQRRIASS